MNKDLVAVYRSTAPPFPGAIMASAYAMSMTESLGIDDRYEKIYDVIDRGNGEWYFSQEDIDRIAPKVIDVFTNDPKLLEHISKEYLKRIKKVAKLLDRDTIEDRLQKMRDEEMIKFFKETAKLYREASAFVEPPNFSLEIGGQEIVRERLEKFFKEKNITLRQSEFENYFAVMSNFTEMSFVQRAEMSLMKIALAEGGEKKKLIDQHEKDYYWQFYDYFGPLLDAEKISEELKPFEKLGRKELEARIKEAEEKQIKAIELLKNTMKKYELPKDLETILRVFREGGFLYSDVKKEMTSRANVGFGVALKFLADKFDIEELDIHYASPEEIVDLLSGKGIDRAILKRRFESCVVVCQDEKIAYEFLRQKEQEAIRDEIGKVMRQEKRSLKGMAACSGKHTGTVKIIKNASQINRIEEGDIMVATMTTVNYVPAMRKAGAILTDLGGITCHAAIVSRELNKPCIIALKEATKILKDGDLVEVNANHGIVRILKQD